MKSFVIKVINLFLIVGIVIGYNVLLEFRNKDDEIAKLNAQLQSLQLTVGATSDGSSQTSDYKDGTYTYRHDLQSYPHHVLPYQL